ncbi:hypothetical protein EGM87_17365 [Sphingobium sp. RSMS]|uniref:hypothetical protein n=1 Tax=Sphingobium sp. RSMS TaxID=520734 RepID=UPI0010F92563|nr:hypothetical protein [Sphingobium sp. RSMS]UXC90765.1 hypothetical protein EGM87_17365 [Sphingobium sp. RSMS]
MLTYAGLRKPTQTYNGDHFYIVPDSMRPELDKKEIARRVFERAAWVMQQSWEENWRHSRLLDEPLIPNHIITAGRSRASADHREHVVPLALIRNQCEKMFSSGADASAVAKLLERHLKIVMISKAERQRLDFELGLKVRMPEGWSFDDENADPFARLKAAGIEWDQLELNV